MLPLIDTMRFTTIYDPTIPPAMEAPNAANKEGNKRGGRREENGDHEFLPKVLQQNRSEMVLVSAKAVNFLFMKNTLLKHPAV